MIGISIHTVIKLENVAGCDYFRIFNTAPGMPQAGVVELYDFK
jgi:hypothetical protein